MSKETENYLKVLLSLLSMSFLIYIGSTLFKRVRLDITQEGIYTLSEGTKNMLGKLDAPLRLRLYYSKTAANKGTEGLRTFNNYYNYVRELLRQYASHSRNNIEIEYIDPRPDTEDEAEAIAFGLKRFDLTNTESYFFGLVAINESGTEKVIEFFDPAEKDKLEYALTKLIYTTLNPRKKTIGIFSPMDIIKEEVSPTMARLMMMQGKPVERSWLVVDALREFYNVRKVGADEFPLLGLDALVIIHPTGFNENQLYAIDQYLMRGGKVLVFADPNVVADPNNSAKPGSLTSSPDGAFEKLMEKWGVTLKRNTFAGDLALAGFGKYSPNAPPAKLLALLQCDQRCVEESKDPISSQLKSLAFAFPGALNIMERDGIVHSTVLSTTDKGNIYSVRSPYELSNPQVVMDNFREGDKPVPLVVKSMGEFSSIYEKTPESLQKKLESDENKTFSHLNKAEKPGAVMTFADLDFLADHFAFKQTFLGMQRVNDNSVLFVNAVEGLSGDVDLMGVRSKGKISRGFDRIEAIEIEAERQTADKVKEINSSLSRYQNELRELSSKTNEQNLAVIQNEGLRKRKELAKKIALLKKELRGVKREGREKIESIGRFFQILNTFMMPLFVALIGFVYTRKRITWAKKKNNTSASKDLNSLKEAKA